MQLMSARVLLVEDDARLASMVADYLGEAGFRLDVASNGAEAMRLVAADDFDAVILDLMLPDADGLDLCRSIRAKSDIPLLMLTAKSLPEDVVQGLTAGADDYLAKPFELPVLLARVKGLLRRRDWTRGEDGPRTVKELGDLAKGFVGTRGLWVDLVRVPPSGTWERRKADRLALAEDWVGPVDATESEGLTHLVRAYLRAFGPATWSEIGSWAGISASAAKTAGARLDLRTFRDDAGRQLFDLPDGPLPDPETPAPVRFLPHWDTNLLVHARRTGLLPEPFRPRIFSTKNSKLLRSRRAGGSGRRRSSSSASRVSLSPRVRMSFRCSSPSSSGLTR